MNRRLSIVSLALIVVLQVTLVASCGPTPAPQVVEVTRLVEKEVAAPTTAPQIVEVTRVVEKEVEKVVEKQVTTVVEKQVTTVVEKVVEKQVPASEGPIELIIMHVHPAYDAFGQNTADPAFQELHPNVTIKRELVAGWIAEFYPKLITMHAAGTPWDVAQLPHSGILVVLPVLKSKGLMRKDSAN